MKPAWFGVEWRWPTWGRLRAGPTSHRREDEVRSDRRTGVNRRGLACTILDTGRRRANLRLTVSMGSQDLQYVVLEHTSHASPAAPSPRRPPSAPLGLSYPASLAAGRWVHPSQPPSHSFCDALLSRKPDRGPSWAKDVGPGRKAACKSRYHFARRSRTRGLDTRAERGRISTWSRKYPTGLQASCGGWAPEPRRGYTEALSI